VEEMNKREKETIAELVVEKIMEDGRGTLADYIHLIVSGSMDGSGSATYPGLQAVLEREIERHTEKAIEEHYLAEESYRTEQAIDKYKLRKAGLSD
jgi:hypothetical protein